MIYRHDVISVADGYVPDGGVVHLPCFLPRRTGRTGCTCRTCLTYLASIFTGDSRMKSARKLTIVYPAICAILLVTALPVIAHWGVGTQMPIARLLKNLGDYVKIHPEDAGSRYTLARVYSAAFAGRDNFRVYEEHAKYCPDRNGKSDPGEVIPVQKLGITRIAANSAGKSDGVLYNPTGVQFADGHICATFGWVAEPVYSRGARLRK